MAFFQKPHQLKIMFTSKSLIIKGPGAKLSEPRKMTKKTRLSDANGAPRCGVRTLLSAVILVGVTSLKKQSIVRVLQLSQCLEIPLFCVPLPPHLFLYSSPFVVPMQDGLRAMLCCLICTAHSCSFIIVPLAEEALFSGQTMGVVVTESTVVMSHLPPCAISLSCPPFSPAVRFSIAP